MNAQNICTKCNFSADDSATRCPQCGAWTKKARRLRRLGGVLIFLGLVLVVMMGTITVFIAPTMLSPQVSGSSTHFNGTPQQAMLILTLFGIVIVFGIVCIASGLWQIFTGRRNIWIMVLVLAIAFLLFLVAQATTGALDKKKETGAITNDTRTLSSQVVKDGNVDSVGLA